MESVSFHLVSSLIIYHYLSLVVYFNYFLISIYIYIKKGYPTMHDPFHLYLLQMLNSI